MLLVYIILAALSVTAVSAGDDDEEEVADESICEINANPKKEVRPSQCCQVGDILPIDFKEKFKICEKIHPFVYQESYGQDPWTMWVHHTACLDECIWYELGMLDEPKKVVTSAVREIFTEGIEEPVLTAVNKALDNCFAIYEEDLRDDENNVNLDCRSGATELLGCYMREVFLNCPDTVWTDTTACSTLWDKVESCPKIHVMLHKPSLPQEKPNKLNAEQLF